MKQFCDYILHSYIVLPSYKLSILLYLVSLSGLFPLYNTPNTLKITLEGDILKVIIHSKFSKNIYS